VAKFESRERRNRVPRKVQSMKPGTWWYTRRNGSIPNGKNGGKRFPAITPKYCTIKCRKLWLNVFFLETLLKSPIDLPSAGRRFEKTKNIKQKHLLGQNIGFYCT